MHPLSDDRQDAGRRSDDKRLFEQRKSDNITVSIAQLAVPTRDHGATITAGNQWCRHH